MTYTVAVRELCEFTAKQGDLDLRFTPAPTAQEGIAGHAVAAARRGTGYRAEVALSGVWEADGLRLLVRGRADGYDPAAQRVDEVKTFKGMLSRQPASHRHLHWAQARLYGWLLCKQEGLAHMDVSLVYLDITTQQETVFTERCSADALRTHFEAQCQRFAAWARQEAAHRLARDAALAALVFPFGGFRQGQRPLAEAVYKAAVSGRCLLAQATTGIGKTMGTVFPVLKAAPGQRIDKLFFLAAKTSGRQTALDALQRLTDPATAPATTPAATPSTPLRVLELVARDKACEHPGSACHGDACPLARGFYDRLPAARAAALAAPAALHAPDGNAAAPSATPQPLTQPLTQALTQAKVRSVALAHQVCPYYLSQELARWADVVVGDYNYYFDHGGLLHGLAQANQWRVALLVDEAHNLVERARRMYTAELHPASLAQARRSPAASRHAPLKKALDKVRRQWVALDKAQTTAYAVLDAVPERLLAALQQCTGTLGEHFAEHPADLDPALQAFYFDALHWLRLAESTGPHALVDITQAAAAPLAARPRAPGRQLALADAGEPPPHRAAMAGPLAAPAGQSTLCIRNIVPAPYLRPRLAAAHTSTLFSATLQPVDYYANLLGLPENHAWIDVESPFSASQLTVQVARHISTRYAHRSASLAAVADLMAQQFRARPGNYLAFFSSYDYLQQAASALARRHGDVPHWCQSRGMAEAGQQQFLARFTDSSQGIGFAVLGGAFAEGVDLPGQRLIGAFLATLGLPQVNPVNEQIRERMQALFGAGYDYTYLYPGLQKVVQAAGRVIRTPTDEGVVHLMDDRFARPEVQRLLPGWWQAVPGDDGTVHGATPLPGAPMA